LTAPRLRVYFTAEVHVEEKRGGVGWLGFIVILLLVLLGAWLYAGWQSSQRVFPQGVTIAGLSAAGMTRNQALAMLQEVYAQPITVYYEDRPILLVPEMVELMLDVPATTANLEQVLLAQEGPRGFIEYAIQALGRREMPSQDIRPVLTYSRERIDAFLRRTAQQFDHPPLDPVPLPEADTFRPAQHGTALDVEASLAPLIAALLSPTNREVHLVVRTEPARPASMEVLRDALDAKLESFTGIASIFIKNLDTGQELCYNCNLAFSGVSLLKIPIILQRYRQLDAAPDAETLSLIKAALTESDNAAANLILQQIGAGNPYTGALQVTDFVRQLGLENTFLAAPYDLKDGIPLPNFSTPANSQTAFNTEPDPYIQTTALEMGLLMEGLGQCAEGVGMLRLIFPREITPAECEDILNIMEHNQVTELLEAGMPPGIPVAHKNGWTGQTHADVALAATPNGRVVIAAFLYQPEWLVWEESAPLFADLGRLTYRFFNGETE